MSTTRTVLLTPSGAGAVGVIRVCGPDAIGIVEQLFHPALSKNRCADTHKKVLDEPSRARGEAIVAREPGRLRYGTLVDNDETIDDVLITPLADAPSPEVEICAHGGVRVLERILQSLADRGAPLADSWAQTGHIWRASNLIEEEALTALVQASTARAVRFLSWQRMHLANALMSTAGEIETGSKSGIDALHAMMDRAARATVLLKGARVAIVGLPNSGKSTLFNRLVGRTAAVVTDRAGTTRDWVDQSIDLSGIPVTLVDTAGHHEQAGDLERRAIHSGWTTVQAADLFLFAIDSSCILTNEGRRLVDEVERLRRCIIVSTKADLPRRSRRGHDVSVEDSCELRPELRVSAMTGDGIEGLRGALTRSLGVGGDIDEAPSLFTERQVCLVRSILDSSVAHDGVASAIRSKLIGTATTATTNEGTAL